MTYIAKPTLHHPSLQKNAVGYTRRDYEGRISTLCAGCGHDSISAALIQAFWELGIEPHRVAKMSGIGCSSKTPDYFLAASHGLNSVHGRMPSVLTGAALANRELLYLGISGDGDTASIGIGQFIHAIRRRVPMVYVVENNGVYGLTKGQFSPTADSGSASKRGAVNHDEAVDLVSLALQLGATYVARGFSGDKAQLVPLLKGALAHGGTALVDVISPCVAFNNHLGSTKSYSHVREHNAAVNRIDFIDLASAPSGSADAYDLPQPDGSLLRLRALREHDVGDRHAALAAVQRWQGDGLLPTGLLHLDPSPRTLPQRLGLAKRALNALDEAALCPGLAALERINAALR